MNWCPVLAGTVWNQMAPLTMSLFDGGLLVTHDHPLWSDSLEPLLMMLSEVVLAGSVKVVYDVEPVTVEDCQSRAPPLTAVSPSISKPAKVHDGPTEVVQVGSV